MHEPAVVHFTRSHATDRIAATSPSVRHAGHRRHLRPAVRWRLGGDVSLRLPVTRTCHAMNIDVYERIWMWIAGVIIVLFMSFVGASTFGQGLHPPSHIETIDPTKVFQDPRFSRIGTPTECQTARSKCSSPRSCSLSSKRGPRAARPADPVPNDERRRHARLHDRRHERQLDDRAGLHQSVHDDVRHSGRLPADLSEFCGTGHHAMHGRVIVDPAAPVATGATPAHQGAH